MESMGTAQTAESAGFPANLQHAVSFLHPGDRGLVAAGRESSLPDGCCFCGGALTGGCGSNFTAGC
jgi:hypothetical protein